MAKGIRIAIALIVVVTTAASSWAQTVVGRVTKAKAMTYAMGTSSFEAARIQEIVKAGYTVRTARRGHGEITFTDDSILRINERTEMVIQDAAQLRRMQLQRGALWLRVAKGSGTSIQTPVATATVRGTEFAIADNGDLTVIEGEVFYEAGGEGISVFGGESARVGPDGKPVKSSDQDIAPGSPKWWIDLFEPLQYAALSSGQQVVAIAAATFAIGNLDTGGNPPVPEPATMAALGIGAAWFAARSRKKK